MRPEDKKSKARRGRTEFVVFTDLDGTLLDHDTYDWEPAAEALTLCRRLGVPVVPVSSKTRAEMEVIRNALQLDWPFISENGGGVCFPHACAQSPPPEAVPFDGGHVWHLGVRYDIVIRAFREIRKELGRPDLRGFSDMEVEEIALLTGLKKEDAERAGRREYDEPFVVEGNHGIDIDLLERAAGKRGLRVAAGGRFFHLFGVCDKGEAVSRLSDWFGLERPGFRSVGLGDSPNDIPMLRQVDVPVLVRSSRPPSELTGAVPGIRITVDPGPAGWNRAILDLLDHVNGGSGSQG